MPGLLGSFQLAVESSKVTPCLHNISDGIQPSVMLSPAAKMSGFYFQNTYIPISEDTYTYM